MRKDGLYGIKVWLNKYVIHYYYYIRVVATEYPTNFTVLKLFSSHGTEMKYGNFNE